ncbi:Acetylaranotin bis-thiomethyltransferase [Penicillium macrosclerotiorum]|uniref:Acetylaranotin bis-thiomethyltransferase n=1 Tax=Penicillium macrosclerotiorum TaxID=303699 RepID=UPI00254961AB|nr:Acetylaranotin bis-thiomethyltransferase [Penicillium macrosclerotiorum]KAJ5666850.1 Acetylaranotin bis-thiomethyltransferase [Penicillium macrosclerotiorum]
MASQQKWGFMFDDDKFVSQYKTGEHITGRFAQILLDQTGMVADSKTTPDRSLVVFDNACGTAVVSHILHRELDDTVKSRWKLTCGDTSPGMLKWAKSRMENENWQNTEVKLVDAQDTGLPTAHFTHVITAFAYMGCPKSLSALDESVRILQPGGTIAFSTWIDPAWISVVQQAAKVIPGNFPFPSSKEFLKVLGSGEWDSVSWIETQLKERGLQDIQVQPNTQAISLTVPDFSKMVAVMFPMITKFFWTEEQRERQEEFVGGLQQYLERTYGKDGEMAMEWTAILSTARKAN